MNKRKKTKFMKKNILLIVVFCCLITIGHAESVSLYGFTPASVDSLPGFQPKNKPRQLNEIEFITFVAKIDKKGKLKSIKCVDEKDSLFLKYIDSYMHGLTFQPATVKNKKKKSVLPFQVLFANRVNSPQFFFPLEQDTLVQDYELFENACSLNEIQLPKVLMFPSYFANVNVMDSSNRYPFIIEKISLKENKVTAIENDMSTYDPFIQQIQSAILYAEFSQAKMKKKLQDNPMYLMVSFFPQLSYPVAPFNGNQYDSTQLLNNYRVRFISKFSTLLSEPLPKSSNASRYSRKLLGSMLMNPINTLVRIDTLGRAVALISGTKNNQLSKSVQELISRLRFFPALNYENELVEFKGIIRIEPFDELDVRISYLWFN